MSENQWLTDRQLKKLGAGDHADGKIAGLVFRVRERGGKSWAYLYRTNGRRRRLTLGAYPALGLADARAAARAARRAVSLGRDPAEERRAAREADTFGTLAARYLEQWAKPRKRTWAGDERMLRKHVLPRWRHLPVASIQRRDVRELLEKVAEAGPTAANRVRALLSKMFNYAIGVDVVATNPVTGTLRHPERARERVLEDEEIRKLWTGGTPAQRLILLTAQRPSVVYGLRWSAIGTESGETIWTIPGLGSKNGRPYRVPLSKLALEQLPARTDSDRVFPTRTAKEKLPGIDASRKDVQRTAITRMASLGIPVEVLSRLQGHVQTDVTSRHYVAHGYDREKREALDRWVLELRRIVSGEAKGADVVEFRR